MAKKKNKQVIRPWCWYCEREFEDEKVLMQHQKAKHFKCGMCPRRLNTAGGLAVHIQQVHKLEADNLPKIDNALPGRDGYEVEIFGMEGIPAPDVADYKRRKEIELGLAAGSISQPPQKRQKIENKPLTEAELKAALEAHKALMGRNQAEPAAPAPTDSGGAIFGAPQTYATPPIAATPVMTPPAPNMMPPPFFPGGMPPPGMSFPPPPFMGMPGMPPGPPPPGFPGFPPPGMGPPPFAPNGMPGMPPPGFPYGPPGGPSPPPRSMPGGLPPPNFVPQQQQQQPPITNNGPPAASSIAAPPVATKPTLPNPKLTQTNPTFKKPTILKHSDANFSPEELRAYHPKYFMEKPSAAGSEDARGKKRARAEDFL